MTQFAKLYETDLGQILVKIDEGDEGAEVRYYFTPANLGVCSIALQFGENWDSAEKFFDEVTKENAQYRIANLINDILHNAGSL